MSRSALATALFPDITRDCQPVRCRKCADFDRINDDDIVIVILPLYTPPAFDPIGLTLEYCTQLVLGERANHATSSYHIYPQLEAVIYSRVKMDDAATRIDLTPQTVKVVEIWCATTCVESPTLNTLFNLVFGGSTSNTLYSRVLLCKSILYAQLYAKLLCTSSNNSHATADIHRSLDILSDVQLDFMARVSERLQPFFEMRQRIATLVLARHGCRAADSQAPLSVQFQTRLLHARNFFRQSDTVQKIAMLTDDDVAADRRFESYLEAFGCLPSNLATPLGGLSMKLDTATPPANKIDAYDMQKYLYDTAAVELLNAKYANGVVASATGNAHTAGVLGADGMNFYSRPLILGDSHFASDLNNRAFLVPCNEYENHEGVHGILHPQLYMLLASMCTRVHYCSLPHKELLGIGQYTDVSARRRIWHCVFTGKRITSPYDGLYCIWYFVAHAPIVTVVHLEYYDMQITHLRHRLLKMTSNSPLSKTSADNIAFGAMFSMYYTSPRDRDVQDPPQSVGIGRQACGRETKSSASNARVSMIQLSNTQTMSSSNATTLYQKILQGVTTRDTRPSYTDDVTVFDSPDSTVKHVPTHDSDRSDDDMTPQKGTSISNTSNAAAVKFDTAVDDDKGSEYKDGDAEEMGSEEAHEMMDDARTKEGAATNLNEEDALSLEDNSSAIPEHEIDNTIFDPILRKELDNVKASLGARLASKNGHVAVVKAKTTTVHSRIVPPKKSASACDNEKVRELSDQVYRLTSVMVQLGTVFAEFLEEHREEEDGESLNGGDDIIPRDDDSDGSGDEPDSQDRAFLASDDDDLVHKTANAKKRANAMRDEHGDTVDAPVAKRTKVDNAPRISNVTSQVLQRSVNVFGVFDPDTRAIAKSRKPSQLEYIYYSDHALMPSRAWCAPRYSYAADLIALVLKKSTGAPTAAQLLLAEKVLASVSLSAPNYGVPGGAASAEVKRDIDILITLLLDLFTIRIGPKGRDANQSNYGVVYVQESADNVYARYGWRIKPGNMTFLTAVLEMEYPTIMPELRGELPALQKPDAAPSQRYTTHVKRLLGKVERNVFVYVHALFSV